MKRWMKQVSILLALVLAMSGTVGVGLAQTASEARNKKSELQQQKAQTKAQISDMEKKIDKMISNIEKLDTKLDRLSRKLNKVSAQLSDKKQQLKETRKELRAAKKREKSQYESMKKRMQFMYENGDEAYLDIIFTAKSLGDVLNRKEYVEQMVEYDHTMFARYQQTRQTIEDSEKKLAKEVKEVAALKEKVSEQTSTVKTVMSQKRSTLNRYYKNVSEKKALVKRFNKAIAKQDRLIRSIEQRSQSSGSSGVVYSGGQFAWPAPGCYTITSNFGYRIHPVYGTGRMHEGIDIAVPMASTIVAAASGTVVISQYSSSAGNYIMIDHGGGVYSVYMHNSSLLVSVGEQVSQGQHIANSGSTGWSTGPHLHFGVRVNGQYVDPMSYLQS
ncbi:MAG: murein hydrolase activator EnvC family protein [Lachnospiraceae bacterium]